MIRNVSQIVKTPIPKHTAAQALQILESMEMTGDSYYLDHEGS